jgi:endonuclease/exonuclease/phosphatase family metal-dependent hydrolase
MLTRRAALAGLLAAVAWAGLAACSSSTPSDSYARPVETPEPTPTRPVPTPEPTPEPTEFRVAFINLMSPVQTDANDTSAGDTFDQRLQLVIDELRSYRPDLVGFSEATWTAKHGSAVAKLAAELKMEPLFVQANPWFAGRTEQQNRELAKQIGFEEGELVLVRSDRWVVLGATPAWLNPRTSETEGRAALHVRIKGPSAVGTVDVFITHLTGGGERLRGQQAESFAEFVRKQRTGGPAIILADLSDPPGSPAYQALIGLGFEDPLAGIDPPTCCRPGVIGDQPEPTVRTSFILSAGWRASVAAAFATKPGRLPDGRPLYASDHNGVWALFPVPKGSGQ